MIAVYLLVVKKKKWKRKEKEKHPSLVYLWNTFVALTRYGLALQFEFQQFQQRKLSYVEYLLSTTFKTQKDKKKNLFDPWWQFAAYLVADDKHINNYK